MNRPTRRRAAIFPLLVLAILAAALAACGARAREETPDRGILPTATLTFPPLRTLPPTETVTPVPSPTPSETPALTPTAVRVIDLPGIETSACGFLDFQDGDINNLFIQMREHRLSDIAANPAYRPTATPLPGDTPTPLPILTATAEAAAVATQQAENPLANCRAGPLWLSPDGTQLGVAVYAEEISGASPAWLVMYDALTLLPQWGLRLDTDGSAIRPEEILPGIGLKWDPAGRQLALLDGGAIRVLDPLDGQETGRIPEPDDDASGCEVWPAEDSFTWSPDGAFLRRKIPGGVESWNPASGARVSAAETDDFAMTSAGDLEEGCVMGMAWTQQADAFLTFDLDIDLELKAWSAETGELVEAFINLPKPAGGLTISGNNEVAYINEDDRLVIATFPEGGQVDDVPWQGGPIDRSLWSPDGSILAFSDPGRLYFYTPGYLLPDELPAASGIGGYTWLPDSQRLLYIKTEAQGYETLHLVEVLKRELSPENQVPGLGAYR